MEWLAVKSSRRSRPVVREAGESFGSDWPTGRTDEPMEGWVDGTVRAGGRTVRRVRRRARVVDRAERHVSTRVHL